MNKYALVTLSALFLSGCFGNSVDPVKQCDKYATQLESSGDVIQVLQTYIEYRDSKTPAKSIALTCWNGFLRRQDLNYTCLNKTNTSDECILYRRDNNIESELHFFDFKRFLPPESKIMTEKDFKITLNYYETNIKMCDEQIERTTQEKQACRDKVANDVRDFSKYGAKTCKSVLNEEYTALLKEKGEWYKWAINHDPWGFYKEWRAMTGINLGVEASAMYQPIYSKSAASARVKEELETWGQEHLCSTSNYKNDLSRLGFRLN